MKQDSLSYTGYKHILPSTGIRGKSTLLPLHVFQDKLKWSEEGNLIAHEFGHVLGAASHADEFYPPERATELIMWSDVSNAKRLMFVKSPK